MNRARSSLAALAAMAIAVLTLELVPSSFAAFASQSENGGNVVAAATDFVAPQVTAVAVGKTQPGVTGFVKQGGTYFVYAKVGADTGSPPSGIASVKANVAALTTGAGAVELTAGSFTVDGTTYNYRAELTANASLAEGAKSFAVTASDKAGNSAGREGSATVDNTAPKGSDVQTASVGGGTNGQAEQGDSILLTFSEPVEPESILAGWDGNSTNVVVRIYDNSLLLGLLGGDDAVQVFNAANTTALPLGSVDLGRTDYVTGVIGGGHITFGAGATASTMTMSGNTVTVVLGNYESEGALGANRATAAGTGTMTWVPAAGPYDRAANALSTASVTESGSADKEF